MEKFKGLKKIEGIKALQKYGLPMPETIFVSDFKKQETEIDRFLKNKRIITVRSDTVGKTDFAPLSLRCERCKAKLFVKNLVKKGFVAILQRYVPIRRDRVSGNILILKNYILMELMGTGPLTWLNRGGLVQEQAKFKKNSFLEVEHFGKRLIQKSGLVKILKMVKDIPTYKLLEFTLRPEGIYFWQIRDDRTAKALE